jgi:hypothetical protein
MPLKAVARDARIGYRTVQRGPDLIGVVSLLPALRAARVDPTARWAKDLAFFLRGQVDPATIDCFRRLPVPQKASNEISLYLMQLCRPFIERDHDDASHGLFQLSQIFRGLGGMFVLRRYFPQFARR